MLTIRPRRDHWGILAEVRIDGKLRFISGYQSTAEAAVAAATAWAEGVKPILKWTKTKEPT